MLHHVIMANEKGWDKLIPLILWAYREIPDASTGISPNQLVYGRRLKIISDNADQIWNRTSKNYAKQYESFDPGGPPLSVRRSQSRPRFQSSIDTSSARKSPSTVTTIRSSFFPRPFQGPANWYAGG